MSSLTGHLLVAAPQLNDPNFVRTVVLLIQHTDEGALATPRAKAGSRFIWAVRSPGR